MKKFRADASLMRISRQCERDEMCYRNDLEVIPFSTDATIEEDFLFEYQLPGFAWRESSGVIDICRTLPDAEWLVEFDKGD